MVLCAVVILYSVGMIIINCETVFVEISDPLTPHVHNLKIQILVGYDSFHIYNRDGACIANTDDMT